MFGENTRWVLLHFKTQPGSGKTPQNGVRGSMQLCFCGSRCRA